MSDLLKGNYKLDKPVTDVKAAPTLEETFEKEALKRLGGSIAFVSKRKVIWDEEGDKGTDKESGKDKKGG